MTSPPDREALLALADRCEKATGPDRNIDRAICPIVGIRVVDEGHPLGVCYYDENRHGIPLPQFTRSIDAALTLVPESKNTMDVFSLELWTGAGIYEPHVRASAWVPGAPRVFAATSALALTAAALKARALAGDRP